NDDIWLASPDGTWQRRLTTFDGQDGSPMWSPDGRKLYYVTEEGSARGCANIVAQVVEEPNPPTPFPKREGGAGPGDLPPSPLRGGAGGGVLPTPQRVTKHEEDTVRRARVSGD